MSGTSNTQILIKRSVNNSTPTPGSLQAGELAFSYVSNTLFIGTSDGTNTLSIGGDGIQRARHQYSQGCIRWKGSFY